MISDVRFVSRRPQEGPDAVELLIKEAQRESRKRRLRNGFVLIAVLLLVVGVIVYEIQPGGPTKPHVRTGTSEPSSTAIPLNSRALYSVRRVLKLDTDGSNPSVVATGYNSMFMVGTFDQLNATTVDDLIRVNVRTWRIAAEARFPNVTSIALGDGALWWATGQNAFDIPAPEKGRALLKVDPSTLRRHSTFILPNRILLVTVAGRSLWVATPTMLYRLDPESGHVLAKVFLKYAPIELSASELGSYLYVLGSSRSKEFLTVYNAESGERVAQRPILGVTGGPLATTSQGVWVATGNLKNQTASARYYKGNQLVPSGVRGGHPFDTSLYSGAGVIWLVDSGGQGSTECLNQSTGRVRARGGSLGVGGSVATLAGKTYLLYDQGFTNYFSRVRPSRSCN